MRRVIVDKETQVGNTIFYIHKNPVHHGLVKEIGAWPHSSYPEYMHENYFVTEPDEVISWFGSLKGFMEFHQQPIERKTS